MKKKLAILLSILFVAIGCLVFLFFNIEVGVDLSNVQDEINYGEQLNEPIGFLKGKYIFTSKTELPVNELSKNDLTKIGTYTNVYETSWWIFKETATKDITVKDTTPPIITLSGESKISLLVNTEYNEEGYSAIDEIDGNITDKVIITKTDNSITYEVEDLSGNKTSVVRTIEYYDDIAPEITLNGDKEISLYQGEAYSESGAIASDNYDGDITNKIVISGEVDVNTIGNYTLTYTITDSYGNTSEVTRVITIKEKPASPPQAPAGEENRKVIYLTFDDGPGKYTQQLLDVLDKYNVKATFFVVNHGDTYNYLIAEEAKRGHSIGVHSYTHEYSNIYTSEDAYWADFDKMQAIIKEQTGKETNLFRFPGGSSNTVSKNYNTGIMTRLTESAEDKGYYYFDWNVSSGDAGETTKTDKVISNVINGISGKNISVVLQHDIKGFSVDAVEEIIKWGLENGYTFLPLSEGSFGAHHHVNN